MYLTQISGITGKTLSPCFSKNPSTMSMTHGNIATLNFFLLQIHLFTNSNSKGLQSIIKDWHLWKKGITKCPVLENDLSANFHLTRDLFAWSSLKSNNWKTKKTHKQISIWGWGKKRKEKKNNFLGPAHWSTITLPLVWLANESSRARAFFCQQQLPLAYLTPIFQSVSKS